jgi:hypothetical protein
VEQVEVKVKQGLVSAVARVCACCSLCELHSLCPCCCCPPPSLPSLSHRRSERPPWVLIMRSGSPGCVWVLCTPRDPALGGHASLVSPWVTLVPVFGCVCVLARLSCVSCCGGWGAYALALDDPTVCVDPILCTVLLRMLSLLWQLLPPFGLVSFPPIEYLDRCCTW